MYVREKVNKSGSTSIQIIDKSTGKYKVVISIGSSKDPVELEFLKRKARRELEKITKQDKLDFEGLSEKEFVDVFMNSIESFSLIGPELLLGKIFDEIGFNLVPESLFRHLVITRIVYPGSKLKTVDYLQKYLGINVSVWEVYRYLDRIQDKLKDQIKKINLEHTLKVIGESMSVIFYDVTTLYFETSEEDEFRKTGFSKDGKHQQPQIVLGLLVSEHGYPLDYTLFEGSQYEGDTLKPIIEQFEKLYSPEKLIVVADAGILSKSNRDLLSGDKYQYILGARIKNETTKMKQKIIALNLKDNQSTELLKEDQSRLIISYKKKRALKDEFNRKRGLEKLKKKIRSGLLNKQHINNKGYNKYLTIDGKATIKIDEEKYEADKVWDGLKGYVTNTTLTKEKVIEKYGELWQIEKVFRISKTDLQIRPIYHRNKKRIQAHICIAFVACKIYKELERQLKLKGSSLSPEKAVDIIKTIYKIEITTPFSNKVHKRLILKAKEQRDLLSLFDLHWA